MAVMAEGVQGVMEDMLADLLNFVENKVFTQEEVDAVVQRRKDLEYKLARRSPAKRHFLKAIQYELSLESLRIARKIDLQITRPFASDHSSTSYTVLRRITNLFHRLLRRYPGDIQSWKEFIGFCLRKQLAKPLEGALARALQLNPCCEDLWLLADAAEKTQKQGDWETRRALLQRAVRLNSSSVKLWEAYLRMEVEYWQTVREREGVSKELRDGAIPRLVLEEAEQKLGRGKMDKLLQIAQSHPALLA